ncbi:MAG: hypothetical protein KGQ28_08965, partial [Hyphomicrobiales bacterium]|nr:hypothetical protein [Hyphomicrobiales bacterium]
MTGIGKGISRALVAAAALASAAGVVRAGDSGGAAQFFRDQKPTFQFNPFSGFLRTPTQAPAPKPA